MVLSLAGIVTLAAALLIEGGSSYAARTNGMPTPNQVGAGWRVEQAMKVITFHPGKLNTSDSCRYGFLKYTQPVESRALYGYEPSSSQLRVTLFAAKSNHSGTEISKILFACFSPSSTRSSSVPRLGISEAEEGRWLLQREPVGNALAVIYVAQVRGTVAVYSFFGSGSLRFATGAIKGASKSLTE